MSNIVYDKRGVKMNKQEIQEKTEELLRVGKKSIKKDGTELYHGLISLLEDIAKSHFDLEDKLELVTRESKAIEALKFVRQWLDDNDDIFEGVANIQPLLETIEQGLGADEQLKLVKEEPSLTLGEIEEVISTIVTPQPHYEADISDHILVKDFLEYKNRINIAFKKKLAEGE